MDQHMNDLFGQLDNTVETLERVVDVESLQKILGGLNTASLSYASLVDLFHLDETAASSVVHQSVSRFKAKRNVLGVETWPNDMLMLLYRMYAQSISLSTQLAWKQVIQHYVLNGLVLSRSCRRFIASASREVLRRGSPLMYF